MTKELQQAAQAVLDRWNSPKWEWHKQGPTGELMANLQAAIAQPEQPATVQGEPVAIPDEIRKYAKAMQKDGYRGPFFWASKVIDFVADYTAPRPAQEGDAKDAERLAILKAIGDAGLILIKTHLGFELIKKELVIAQTDKHARSEWLQESSYRAGAKAGYNLGVGENVEGLSRLLEAHSYPENRAAIASQKATQ